MGHIRLGELPRTRRFDQVVELIERDGDAAALAAAALAAAEAGFRQAAEDEGLGHATWLLTQIPLAARDPNYLDRLRAIGIPVDHAPGLLDIVGGFSDAIDSHSRRTGGRTDLGERAQMAAVETLTNVLGAEPAPDSHPYLTRKGVRAHGLRLDAGGRLLVPLHDPAGALLSVQTIECDGGKRYLASGRVRGGFHLLGEVSDAVAVAEGYATAASVHEATGLPVAVALDCGNLLPVAEVLRARHPAARMVFCADDDSRTAGNPGVMHATAAARAVGGWLAVPDFGADCPDGATDFNDLAQHAGPGVVRACVEAARPVPAAGSVEAVLEDCGLTRLAAESPPADVEAVLRKLAEAVAGADPLRRELVVAAAKTCLKNAKVSSGSKLVDAACGGARADEAEASAGATLALADPEPARDAADGAVLLDAIAEALTRYVVLADGAADAIALWVLHTYLLAAAWCSPLLVLTSAAKRCGKALVLELLSWLVRRPLATSSVSPSALYRTVEKYAPTLLVDEADAFFAANEELRGIVNCGHTSTSARALRCVGDDSEPRAFSTWCPKAVAGIGKLADTLMDRAVVIPMRRRAAGEHVEMLRRDRVGKELEPLRRAAMRWSLDHADELRPADPVVPGALHDRARDNWRPLLAIADAAGGNWPERARRAAILLADGEDEDVAVQLLGDIREALGGGAASCIPRRYWSGCMHWRVGRGPSGGRVAP